MGGGVSGWGGVVGGSPLQKMKQHHMSNRHGTCEYRTYRAWQMMKQRCTNPKTNGYDRYGALGVTYHPAWEAFRVFLADVGLAPTPQHTLDRVESGDYVPGNVRWATHREQQSNLKSNRLITFRGETATHAEWARRCGVTRQALWSRVARRGEQQALILYLEA